MAFHGQTPFRFFDDREKYLLFVMTGSEKRVAADRVAMELEHISPEPPALRVFDVGMGDATVLTWVMRSLHEQFPTVPSLCELLYAAGGVERGHLTWRRLRTSGFSRRWASRATLRPRRGPGTAQGLWFVNESFVVARAKSLMALSV